MCIHVVRICPGCGAATHHREVDVCNQAIICREGGSIRLPLRREHFHSWDCSTTECPFNNGHLQDVECAYVLVRLAQKGGDVEALDPPLTTDRKTHTRRNQRNRDMLIESRPELAMLMMMEDTKPVPQLRMHPLTSASDNTTTGIDKSGSSNTTQEGLDASGPQQLSTRIADRANVAELPHHVRQRIENLVSRITSKRPASAQNPRTDDPTRKSERWLAEEDELLLSLRNNGYRYRQIEVSV